ncbi:family 78 glycoside hydrolase catalytic domain [Chitinophaga sp. MM2321]|uniref:family 78 glycoside hydrolase catalytic domain n=1 Tax=Chitinophaga sp. MM2321 TaxID=3137178 RepID=UPI0032D57658
MTHLSKVKRILFLPVTGIFLLGSMMAGAQTATDLENAIWIGDARVQPVLDSLMYEDDPAPIFRKEFIADKTIQSATLFITAAGYYSATVNGKILEKNYCDPAWTDFSERIYYAEYDIKDNLLKGKNCISVTLGNGFYNPLPLRFWGVYNLRDALVTGRPMLLAKIKVVYTNGKTAEIVTNKSWKYAYGPVIRNNVYLGEVYDARKEIKGNTLPGFNDTQWKVAVEKAGPGGQLQKTFFPHIQVIDVKKPVKIVEAPKGVYVADMGVNFTGTFKIKLYGRAGDTIRFRFGERIYDNNTLNPMTAVAGQIKKKGGGGPGAPALADQEGMYIFGKSGEVEYSPLFSYRVYRYMEISGLRHPPLKSDMEGIALSANVDRKNSFSSSNDLINSIQQMISRTFLSNLMSIQSDCPGREKFPYGGDIKATSDAFVYNFNMHSFYKKVLYDWVDAYQDTVFIDAAPYVGLKYCGLNYESAIFDLQQNLFQYYGDTALIRELYDFDLKWMDKAARIHPSGIVGKGLGDHESLVDVPVLLLGTAAYLKTAQIMKEFSAVLNNPENEKRFAALEEKIRNSLRDMYWRGDTSGKMADQQSREASMAYINTLPEKEQAAAITKLNTKGALNKQTLYTLLLYCGVIPEKDQPAAVELLLKAIDEAPAGHLTTGIFGTKYILEVLSEYGHADKVFDIVNSTEFPGWGFMIKNGATTQWETWKESDNIFSNCHPMFGSVSGWFYKWLAGIRPVTPGFKKFVIAPVLPAHLSQVKCSYESPQGTIVANWDKKGTESIFTVTVPAGSVATFQLPTKNPRKISVKKVNTNTAFSPEVHADGTCAFDLATGSYLITAE